MRKTNNFFSDEFEDFKPKKSKISKQSKSTRVSFLELDSDSDSSFDRPKRKKNEFSKRY